MAKNSTYRDERGRTDSFDNEKRANNKRRKDKRHNRNAANDELSQIRNMSESEKIRKGRFEDEYVIKDMGRKGRRLVKFKPKRIDIMVGLMALLTILVLAGMIYADYFAK